MICPYCQSESEPTAANCPECGIRIVRKVTGVVKTSSVMIATGDENNFYRSIQEVPDSLRRKLIETTNSENSGMIVIADSAGKEQWTEVIAHREAQQSQAAAARQPVATIETAAAPARRFLGLSWAGWAGVGLFAAAGALAAWAFQAFHW